MSFLYKYLIYPIEYCHLLNPHEPSFEPGLALGLNTFFTSGPKETRAWTIKKNTAAQKAAGVIHSDFEKNFIRAEVVSYNDFEKYGGFEKAKENGKLRVEGKNYFVNDGDVLIFRVNP